MGSSWRIGVDRTERTALVTTGPFAVVRTPIFTAAAGTFTGLALTVPNLVAVAGLAALLIGIQLQVRTVEEPYLLATHRQAYQHQATRVGRFLPGVGRLTARACLIDRRASRPRLWCTPADVATADGPETCPTRR